MIRYWEEVKEHILTPGGDPMYMCPVCRDKRSWHVSGIEMPRHLDECPVCKTKLKYPYELSISKNPFETMEVKIPYPLCVVEDRYGGAYSGARFLAFNMSPHNVQRLPINASDIDCENFWNGKDWDYDVNDYIIGKGDTPEEAIWHLILLLSGFKEDELVASAKEIFLHYAKQEIEPIFKNESIFNIAKRELHIIENNYTFFTRKGSDIEKFRNLPRRIRIRVLTEIITENKDN